MSATLSDTFHGYVNHLAVLTSGKTVKILGGEGLKLFVKDLDGNVQECYHSNIQMIWNK
jgi:hypothetical protein